jgi:hypothetical protein
MLYPSITSPLTVSRKSKTGSPGFDMADMALGDIASHTCDFEFSHLTMLLQQHCNSTEPNTVVRMTIPENRDRSQHTSPTGTPCRRSKLAVAHELDSKADMALRISPCLTPLSYPDDTATCTHTPISSSVDKVEYNYVASRVCQPLDFQLSHTNIGIHEGRYRLVTDIRDISRRRLGRVNALPIS